MHFALAHPLLFFAGLVLAGAAAWWTYRATVPAQTPAARATLVALRTLTLALVLLLIAEPLVRGVERRDEPAVLALLVDESQSIAFQDSLAGGLLRPALARFLDQLPANIHVERFGFAGEARRLGPADTLALTGSRTNLARALETARDALAGRNVQGIALFSDGNYNAGRNPVYPAERGGVPVFAVVVGDTSRLRDVRLRRVEANEVVYAGALAPVRAWVQGLGYGGAPVEVVLRMGGTVLARARALLPPGGAEAPVELAFTPGGAGPARLTVEVSRLEGEATYRNNAQTVTVQVRPDRRQVVLLGAAPEPDVAALRQALESDASLAVTARVQRAPGSFYEGDLPRLDTADVIVLAGFPGAAADAATLARIRAAAEGGVGIAFFATARTDYAMLSRLAGVLPATPAGVPGSFSEAFLQPTPAGSVHPIFDIPQAPPLAARRLPPLFSPDARWTVAPGARVLATAEVRGVSLPTPVFLVESLPRRRAAMLLGAGTWRWNTLPRDLEDAAPFWPAFVANVARWVATPDDARRVRVAPTEPVFDGSETVRFSGQVYDESLQPVENARVGVTVTDSAGREYPFVMEGAGNGRYRLDAGVLPPGDYRFAARATRADLVLGSDAGLFNVGSPALEYQEPRADYRLMQGLAQRTGGRTTRLDSLDALARHIARLPNFSPTVVSTPTQRPLHDYWPLLVLIVVLLSAEWVLRKRGGLA